MPVLQRPGQPDLYYEVDDFTDPWTDAPTLILQHGYCRASPFWYAWVPHLSRHFRVVRPDLRGLGRSSRDFDLSTELSFDAYVADMRAIVEAVGGGPVHYCGESFGGTIGLAFAAKFPALVSSLSIVSSPVFINERARKGYACGHASWPQAVREMGAKAWIAQTNGSTRFPPETAQGFLDWYIDGVAAAGVDMLARMAEVAIATDITDLLGDIVAPVLTLHPSGGVISDDEQLNLLKARLRKASFTALPTPYHMVNFIMPALCAREVLGFAASVDKRICLDPA